MEEEIWQRMEIIRAPLDSSFPVCGGEVTEMSPSQINKKIKKQKTKGAKTKELS